MGWTTIETLPDTTPVLHRAQPGLAVEAEAAADTSLTPSKMMAWEARQGIQRLFHGSEALIMSVWTDHLWRVATPTELCRAKDRSLQLLQCSNDKETKALLASLEQEPESVSDDEAVDEQLDEEAVDTASRSGAKKVSRVQTVPLHPTLTKYISCRISEWIGVVSTVPQDDPVTPPPPQLALYMRRLSSAQMGCPRSTRPVLRPTVGHGCR